MGITPVGISHLMVYSPNYAIYDASIKTAQMFGLNFCESGKCVIPSSEEQWAQFKKIPFEKLKDYSAANKINYIVLDYIPVGLSEKPDFQVGVYNIFKIKQP